MVAIVFRNGVFGDSLIFIYLLSEFDHCKLISSETRTPLKFVSESAISAAQEEVNDDQRK